MMGKFQPGVSGNPSGRPKGATGGRAQALASLDVIMGKQRNKRLLEQALEDEFRRDPVRFFKSVMMPLLPKESKISCENDGIVQWQTLLGETVTKADLERVRRARIPGTAEGEMDARKCG